MNITALQERFTTDIPWRNRMVLTVVGIIIVLNYILFAILTDSNAFAIFPNFPVRDTRAKVSIYVPVYGSEKLSKETGFIDEYESLERRAAVIAAKVLKGSKYENTAPFVPVDIFLKKVWFTGEGKEICVLDFQTSPLQKVRSIIPGSEKKVTEGISKSIREAMPHVKEVVILNHGIPGRPLWELYPKDPTSHEKQ
jgi:hypothetical protein